MELNIDMQGWFAVIVDEKCVGAFVEYEDALKYKKILTDSGQEVIIERIQHKKG